MSEYQSYEFVAIDRPLTREQMTQLRAISSRATITPTRFCNTYSWGDLKADPTVLMQQYFDMLVYVSNWGAHELMVRFPRRLLSRAVPNAYCAGESLRAKYTGEHVIMTFSSDDEHAADIDDDGDGWMSSQLEPAVSRQSIEDWVRGLADSEKTRLLARLMGDDDPHHLRAELIQRVTQSDPAASDQVFDDGISARRTVQQLVMAAERRTEARRCRTG